LVNKVTGKNLLEIRNYDLYKIKIAQNTGYNVLVIWENDIKKNRLETIKKCINFLEK
jgi:very-short-patch-repair endonuclease